MDAIADTFSLAFHTSPLLSGIALTAAVWYVLVTLRTMSSGKVAASAASGVQRQEAMLRARELQQQRLEEANRARFDKSQVSGKAPAPAAPADDIDMPPRMREAMERRKGKQPAPAASDCCDAPAAPTKKVVPASDPKSVSARLAKIEKGKGPSAQNPLLGLGQSEKSGSSSVCRRKGGG